MTELPRVDYPLSATHWGLCRPLIENGQLVGLSPHEDDLRPSPNLDALCRWVTSPRRILKPLIRRSFLKYGPDSRCERGKDEFVEVDWDMAMDLAADQIRRVYEQKGPQAVYGKSSGWKSSGLLHSPIQLVRRLLTLCGGYVPVSGTYSTGAVSAILPYVVGMSDPPAEPWGEILEHASRVVFWGADPLITNDVDWFSTIHEGQAALVELKNRKIPTIFINPVRGCTAEFLQSRWVAVKPGTDCALMLGIIHTLLSRQQVDLDLCRRLAVGVDAFLDYVEGHSDGIPKTAHWASIITQIDSEVIEQLAMELASEKTMLCFGWGPQRARFGEQFHFMGYALALFLGQIGQPGCGISTHHHYCDGGAALCGGPQMDAISSKVSPVWPTNFDRVMPAIPVARLTDLLNHPGKVIEHEGRMLEYPEIDLIVWAGGNPFSHQPGLPELEKGWRRPSAVIVADTHMTATARRADIVLPACTSFERNDITPIGTYTRRGIAAMHRVMSPLGQARSDYAIFLELADRLGLAQAFGENRTEADWIRFFYESAKRSTSVPLPDFDVFWQKGTLWFEPIAEDPARDFWRNFRNDPSAFPLPTDSGKIEIFSRRLQSYGYADAPAHPVYLESDLSDAITFPLTLLSIKSEYRLHSQLDGVQSQGKNAAMEICRIHPQDAAARGISEGDVVVVQNSQGSVLARASLTDDVTVGCLVIAHGAWLTGLCDQIDRGAASNLLVPHTPTSRIGNANVASGTGVQVSRWSEDN